MEELKAYMAYDRQGGSEECAVLVFDYTARHARQLAFPTLRDFDDDTTYFDVAAKLLKERFHFNSANKEKLSKGIPHVIDDPEGCPKCEKWGLEIIDGLCENCRSGYIEP